MNLFVLLISHLLSSFVNCKEETYHNEENFEIEGDPDDDDPITYDEKENRWMKDALRNVAYYLRSQKFNGFDTRYFQEKPPPEKSNFYGRFVDPPLKYFHFDVFENCKDDFTTCLRYLYETVLDAYIQRSIDTIYVMKKNNLTLIDNTEEVKNIDNECIKLRDLDNTKCEPFEGPIERFQWSMTASYYMCWYTLLDKPELMHFDEPCDNFANCLQEGQTLHNNDIRADDSVPFQCAMYSFCPDPCCADTKLLLSYDSCQLTDGNPCRSLNNPKCSFNKTLNRSFVSIVYNEWNVSCVCQTDGYRWNSRYGQCVDYNECQYRNPCNNQTEECINIAGEFVCECKFKFKWSSKENKCVEDEVLVRAMKRFSGIDVDAGYYNKPIYVLYWIFSGLLLRKYFCCYSYHFLH